MVRALATVVPSARRPLGTPLLWDSRMQKVQGYERIRVTAQSHAAQDEPPSGGKWSREEGSGP
jgi:hypothetical protein